MKLLATAFLAILTAGNAVAGPRTALPFKASDFATALNETARTSGLSIRAVKTSCKTENAIICNYTIGNGVTVIVSGPTTENANSVVMVFTLPDKKLQTRHDGMYSFVALVAALSRGEDPQERLAVIRRLFSVKPGGEDVKAEFAGISYTFSAPEMGGLWMFASPAK